MREILIHALIATFISILASIAICWTVLLMIGSTMDIFAAAMCILCPIAVAFPASAYTYSQKRKIERAHEALTEAHRELAAMHKQLAERARRDDLTGLFNRSAFIAAVDETRSGERRGSLLIIDADNFKRINDTYGHLAGDDALREIAKAIRRGVRGTDAKGRLGGEEFGVFLAGAGLEQAYAVAERVRKAVESIRFRPDGNEPVRLTVSIGVALADKGADFSKLMGEADKRLYEAKRLGRNKVIAGLPTQAAA